jgi:predicted O-linked N-acetylglucosamine transferase (SPINDLY family)
MGVPTLTRVGNTSVGRGGLSQLFQLDLLEFAAETNEAFVRSAIALAADLPRLAQLRRELRTRLESSALMNGARFARNMEAIYTQAWAAGATAVNPGAR